MRLVVRNTIICMAIAAASTAGASSVRPAATPSTSAAPTIVQAPAKRVQEDDPGYNCASDGNHLCGPGNTDGLPAGCYDSGVLVVPWSNLNEWSRHNSLTSPCLGMAPTQEQESNAAYTAAKGPGWEAAGYDGTDSGIAQYDYDYGLPITGYGIDESKVYDHSHPYGWKAAQTNVTQH